ncbi:TRAP transporter small permease [Rhodovulum sp. YNF3179]|jgi:TRAP-type C4-dicarboxylate transport system permease small subunit|uniref:TRAP transporter small permease n=1 Tax=Rhodovulum sp. YNF3179 TaxID=3425127 RepID=UPI003D3568C9
MQSLIRLIRRAEVLPVLLASVALFVLMVMTFADVVLRSAFNAPIEAATELTRILMAIIVFSVLPIVSARNDHIAVDLTDPVFRRLGIARLRDGLVQIVCGGLLYWPVERVLVLAGRWRDYGDVTEYLAIPEFYVGYFIAALAGLSGLLMVISGLLTLFAPRVLKEAK